MAEFTWLRHPKTGGSFRCPNDALAAWRDLGWEPGDPPEETNPATAERVAWEREQAEKAAAEVAQSKPRKAAARGKTTEE